MRSPGSARPATTPPIASHSTPAPSTAATGRSSTGTGRSFRTSVTNSAWNGPPESSRTRSHRRRPRGACATPWPPDARSAVSRALALAKLVERDQLCVPVRAAAAGRLHLHLVAHRLAHERAADRRRQRDLTARGIDLLGEDDLVRHELVGVRIGVGELHPAAVRHHAARNRRHRVHRELADARLELCDAGAHEVLPVLRRLVLGVLREIAVRRRRRQLLWELEGELVLQVGLLLLEPREDGKIHDACAQLAAGSARTLRASSLAAFPSTRPGYRWRSAVITAPIWRSPPAASTSRMARSSSSRPSGA